MIAAGCILIEGSRFLCRRSKEKKQGSGKGNGLPADGGYHTVWIFGSEKYNMFFRNPIVSGN
jgi:hypothetical protein